MAVIVACTITFQFRIGSAYRHPTSLVSVMVLTFAGKDTLVYDFGCVSVGSFVPRSVSNMATPNTSLLARLGACAVEIPVYISETL